MRNGTQLLVASVGGSLITLFTLLGTSAFADGDGSTDDVPRFVPYEGTLEQDGVPFDGPIELVFRLYDGPTTALPAWEENQIVTVYSGRFSTLLGSSTPQSVIALSTVLAAADDLYLGIAVRLDDETEIALSNRQRFLPVPYAHWATSSTHFTVQNGLLARGANLPDGATITVEDADGATMEIDGNEINAASDLYLNWRSQATVHAGGGIVSSGDIQLGSGGAFAIAGSDQGNGGVAFRQGGNDRLVINSEGQLGNLTNIHSKLKVDDTTEMDGKLTINNGGMAVQGDATFSGGVQFNQNVTGLTGVVVGRSDCSWQDVDSQDSSADDWNCTDVNGFPRVLVGLRLADHSNVGGDGTLVHGFRCCRLTLQVQ